MYIGIVSEWNPFHEGHARLLASIRETCPGAEIACAMSGAFVQRGEPALFDKWARAAWAVKGGASLVVELPAACVLQSADRFAEAGIRLLAALGCTHAAFGAETLTADEIRTAAAWTLTEAFTQELRRFLRTSLPYARAVNQALAGKFPALRDDFSRPNNLLGIQYARTILAHHLPMDILPFLRDESRPVSATAIRREIAAGQPPSHIPDAEKESLCALLRRGAYTDYRRYDDACLLAFRLMSGEMLRRSGLFSEGLENRWAKEMQRPSYEELLRAVKSRRYLYSRLRRIGAALLLSPAGELSLMASPQEAPYARLLALRASSSSLLRRCRLPVVTSTARAERTLDNAALRFLTLDRRACDVQTFCFHGEAERAGRLDYFRSPAVL